MKRDLAPAISILLLLVLVVLIAGAVIFLLASRPVPVPIQINPPKPTSTAIPTETPAPLTVYVTGAVVHPNTVVSLPFGSRVIDAINGAGGSLPTADLERVNLAAVVKDGDQIHLYEIPSPTPTGLPLPTVTRTSATSAPTGEALATSNANSSSPQIVHINTATAEELETLPGIGPALAQRIIAYREANGRFSSIDALMLVRGIGEVTATRLQPFIAFD